MAHLDAAYQCTQCKQIPETTTLYYCARKHHFCIECFRKLQRRFCGNTSVPGAWCPACNYIGKFERRDVDPVMLKKLRSQPGIGRPCRYPALTETLPPSQPPQAQQGDGFTPRPSASASKRPLTCPHAGCGKSVAVTSLLSHFRHDHASVHCYGLDKGRELKLWFDVARVEHGRSRCLALLTLYEAGTLEEDVRIMGSAKVALNTFWLMIGGSQDTRRASSYAIFWLYSNCDEKFWCTLELASEKEAINMSSFCQSVGLHDSRDPENVAASLNCLLVSYGHFRALLSDGQRLNLKVTIH